MLFVCKTSFSQLPGNSSSKVSTNTLDVANTPWKIERLKKEKKAVVPADHIPECAANKKIVIRYTTNSKGKVITVSYLSKESTSSKEQWIEDAKLKTLASKPVIYTRDGVRCYGTYTFIFTADGKLLMYFQNRTDILYGMADGPLPFQDLF